jgi:hypothetical protein
MSHYQRDFIQNANEEEEITQIINQQPYNVKFLKEKMRRYYSQTFQNAMHIFPLSILPKKLIVI